MSRYSVMLNCFTLIFDEKKKKKTYPILSTFSQMLLTYSSGYINFFTSTKYKLIFTIDRAHSKYNVNL